MRQREQNLLAPRCRSGWLRHDGEVQFVQQVRSSLDEVLADAGLPWNQTGPDASGVAVLYCGPVTPYLERFPELGGIRWVGHVSCVDVIVRGGDMALASVTIEGEDLADVLRRTGASAHAVEVEAALLNGSPSVALATIREGMLALYR